MGISTRMVMRSARHKLSTAQLMLEILRLLVFQIVLRDPILQQNLKTTFQKYVPFYKYVQIIFPLQNGQAFWISRL